MLSIPESSVWVKIGDNGIQNHLTGTLYFIKQELDYNNKPTGEWTIYHRGPNTGNRKLKSQAPGSDSMPVFTFHNSILTAKGPDAEAEARAAFERIARRLGAVDLLKEPEPLLPAEEAGQVIADLVEQLEAVRKATEEPLSDLAYQDDDPSDALAIIRVRAADLRALRDALAIRAEGVGDG